MWTTTPSWCCNARSSSDNNSSTYVHVLLQHPVLQQYTLLLQNPLSSKDNAGTSSDILAAAFRATAAAVLIPGSTSTDMKCCCNFRSEDVPCLGLLHELAPAAPSAGQTRARTSCCLRRRDGKECRLYTHNGTKALILHKTRHHFCLLYTSPSPRD